MLSGGILDEQQNNHVAGGMIDLDSDIEKENQDFEDEDDETGQNTSSNNRSNLSNSRYFDPPIENYRFLDVHNEARGFFIDHSQRKNEFISQSQNTLIKSARELNGRKESTSDFNPKGEGSIISQSDQTEAGINYRQTNDLPDDNELNNRTFDGDPPSDDNDGDDFF